MRRYRRIISYERRLFCVHASASHPGVACDTVAEAGLQPQEHAPCYLRTGGATCNLPLAMNTRPCCSEKSGGGMTLKSFFVRMLVRTSESLSDAFGAPAVDITISNLGTILSKGYWIDECPVCALTYCV